MSDKISSSSNSKNGIPQPPYVIDSRILDKINNNDEVNLVETWGYLLKQKKIFWLTFLFIFGLGVALSLFQGNLYEYTTTIEIGTKADRESLIQPIDTVKSEISEAYINQALYAYTSHNPSPKNAIDLNVENPKNTNLIIIKGTGSINQEEMQITLQKYISERLVSKHNSTTQSIISKLESEKRNLNNKIEDLVNKDIFASRKLKLEINLENQRQELLTLQEKKSVLDNAIQRQEKLTQLLQNQYSKDIQNLNIAMKSQKMAAKAKSDTSLLVLITSELQQYRTHISALEERLNIKIPSEKEKLKQQVSDNLRTQKSQLSAIKQAEYSLSKLTTDRNRELATLKAQVQKIDYDILALPRTHAIAPPSRSFQPTNGKKKILIILVAIVIGLFTGLIAAIFSGFLEKVRNQSKET